MLARSGKTTEAERLFERLIGYSGRLGLFAEKIDEMTGDLRGNYPQAFTHIDLINAAVLREGTEGKPMNGELLLHTLIWGS